LRVLRAANAFSPTPQFVAQIDESWSPATPETVRKISALGYFFGREILADQNVPIGIISAAVGSTAANSSGSRWRPPTVSSCPSHYLRQQNHRQCRIRRHAGLCPLRLHIIPRIVAVQRRRPTCALLHFEDRRFLASITAP
jgi:hypothetical protein